MECEAEEYLKDISDTSPAESPTAAKSCLTWNMLGRIQSNGLETRRSMSPDFNAVINL